MKIEQPDYGLLDFDLKKWVVASKGAHITSWAACEAYWLA